MNFKSGGGSVFYEDCTAFEVKAFRALESEVFDFGTGEMKIEGLLGSEDAYYEMDLQEREEQECFYMDEPVVDVELKRQENRIHKRKSEDQARIKRIKDFHWAYVGEKDGYYKRYYYSNIRKSLLKESNKKVRAYEKGIARGAGYRKIFDFYWNLF